MTEIRPKPTKVTRDAADHQATSKTSAPQNRRIKLR